MRDSAKTADAMRHNTLLSGLGGEVLSELLDCADIIDVPGDTVLIRQGEPGDCAFVILAGAMAVEVETAVGTVTMATLGAQQIVGEIAVFTDLPRTATVRALEDTSVIRLGRSALAGVIKQHPDTAFGVIGALGRRIHALNTPLALLTLAANALEREDVDADALGSMLDSIGDQSPFAMSFREIIRGVQANSARRQEMAVAARLQQSILPSALDFGPDLPFQAGAFMRPAREVGGDFYDFFRTADGRVVMVVADVSGKGIPASLFMAVSRTLIRATVQSAATLEEALTNANAQLEAQNEEGLFVTVFIVELDPVSGIFRYINAGHCDAYVRSIDGSVQTLGPTGPALAMIPGRRFSASEMRLEKGELLIVTSDGITEAFAANGDMFGDQRLMDLLPGMGGLDVHAALARIDASVQSFADGFEQSDDITCLALSRIG